MNVDHLPATLARPAPAGRVRTERATKASVRRRKRDKHDKWAREMREHGWECTPPAE